MRGHCTRQEMGDFTTRLSRRNQNNEERLQLVNMLLKLLNDKGDPKNEGRGHHRHGMSRRSHFLKHGDHSFGRRHPFGHHHHHGLRRHRGHHHGHRSAHGFSHHDQNRRCGKSKAMWLIDLTEDDQANEVRRMTPPTNQASTSNQQNDASVTNDNCVCTYFVRRQRGHCGRFQRSVNKKCTNDTNTMNNENQTNVTADGDNVEERGNMTTMVENINIGNSE